MYLSNHLNPKPICGLEVYMNNLGKSIVIIRRSHNIYDHGTGRTAALNITIDQRKSLPNTSPSLPSSHRLPRTQRIRPYLSMANPTFPIKLTQSVYEIFLPALARKHTRELRMRNYTHHPILASGGINDEVRAGRKGVLVWMEGKGGSKEAEVVITCIGGRGCGGMTRVRTAAKGAAEEG